VRRALRDLAGRLRVGLGRDLARLVASVVAHLESRRERWLLVPDNVEDADAALSVIPGAGGDVLVTSRDPTVAARVGVQLEVGAFTRAESVAFLTAQAPALAPSDAERVAARLGDLPLALAQILGLHAATGMALPRYLELFDGHLQELLGQGRPAHDETTLSALADLAVRRLRQDAPVALLLLEVLTHLGPERVDLAVLRRGRGGSLSPALARCLGDPERLRTTMTELVRSGVVSWPADGGPVTMHRLMQECLRHGLGEAGAARGRSNAHALLAAANPGDPDDSSAWPGHALIAPHVVPSGVVESPSPDARRLVLNQIRYLHQIGDYQASRHLALTALDAWSTLDRDESEAEAGGGNDWTLRVARHLGNALRALGDYSGAGTLNAQTLRRLRASPVHGPDHRLTVQVAFSAGYDLRLAGEYRAALELDRDTYARCVRAFGAGDRLTLTAANNLGVSLRHLGEYGEAYRHDLDAYRERSEVLGAVATQTQLSLLNLTLDLFGLGRYDEMLARVHEVGLPPSLRPEQYLPLQLRRCEAMALRACGRHHEGLEVAAASHEDHARWSGPDHERSLAAALTYVNALRSVGRTAEALELAVEARETYRQRFGRSNPLTVAASLVLAAVLRGQGRVEEARRIDGQGLDDVSGVLGSAHPYAVAAANGLAGDLLLDGDAVLAESLLHGLLEPLRDQLGMDHHPVALACAVNLASARRARDVEEAPAVHARAVRALEGVLGTGHPHVVQARSFGWIELDVEPPPA
jgi:tetratricopeptide (TPR) repeat protein